MVVYGLYLYIIVCYTREMCCISTKGSEFVERVISCKVETQNGDYRINFHLQPYKFEIGLYVNFEKWWNIKF